jgi:post-segregation antitoxin (ccd killing protein)
MPKFRHYSPKLSRQLVRELYLHAKAEGVPMTALANRLIEAALENEKQSNIQRVVENRKITQPN